MYHGPNENITSCSSFSIRMTESEIAIYEWACELKGFDRVHYYSAEKWGTVS